MPSSDHEKISFTAKLVALGRSRTDIPFAKDVAELVHAKEVLKELGGIGRDIGRLAVPLMEARYLSLVSAIKASGVRQVVEFASGVSLRGLAMTLADPELTYIETDLPELTQEKLGIMEQILARAGKQRPLRHHVFYANVLSWEDIEPVLAPLSPHEPVALVHEGLFMYLSPAEKDVAARNFARILDTYGGLWITPDFTPLSQLALFMQLEEGQKRILESIEERTGRTFAEGSFESVDEAREFCQRLGFSVVEKPQLDGSYELTSMPAGGQAHEELVHVTESLRLWEMRRPSSQSS